MMLLLRMAILAIVVALGTVVVGWWTIPVAGAVFGLVARGTRRPGLAAAGAGAMAWGGYLAIAAVGGAAVGTFGVKLASAMQLPAWVPIVVTLVFPATLAGLAAYLGARLGGRYLSPP